MPSPGCSERARMAQSCPVADYASALARELRFDPALARRVRAEVEDHLWEASGDDSSPEVQRGAIAKFGPPRELARQYVAAALLVQMRRVGTRAMLAIAVVFIAMEARLAWYAHMRWAPSQDWSSLSAFALALDRTAFLLSLGGALIGCGYIATRRIPARFDPEYGKQLHRGMTMCGVATAALLVVVVVETMLTGIRLSGIEWRLAALVPALSLVAEMAAAGLLIGQIREAARRSAAAALLL
jgi:hypothetical protein